MASLNGPSELQKPISESRLAVIDMSDYGEVPNPLSRVLAQIYGILFAVLARMGAKSLAQSEMVVIELIAKWVASENRR